MAGPGFPLPGGSCRTVCRIDRPPRHFTAKQVGTIACSAIKHGANPKDVIAEVQKCVPEVCDCERVKDILLDVLTLLAHIALVLLLPLAGLARTLAALLARIPVVRRIVAVRRFIELARDSAVLTKSVDIMIERLKDVVGKLPG